MPLPAKHFASLITGITICLLHLSSLLLTPARQIAAFLSYKYKNTTSSYQNGNHHHHHHHHKPTNPPKEEEKQQNFPLTFGVEFEAVLAFKESLLLTHLQTTHSSSSSSIIKNIPSDIRRDLNQVNPFYHDDRPAYMGWALTSPTTTYSSHQDPKRQKFFLEQMEKYGYRGYGGEILTLAADRLLPEGVRVHDSTERKWTDFGRWHVTHDYSLAGVDKGTLGEELLAAGHTDNAVEEWDNHPLELVSRVLPYHPSSMKELTTHITHLRGTPTTTSHFAFTTPHTGLHVHVGLPSSAAFPLPTLQHLAYILLMYEKPINTLLPPWRRNCIREIKTNLDEFIPEPDLGDWEDDGLDFEALMRMEEEDERNGGKDESEEENEKPTCPTIPFREARAKIFARGVTLPRLEALMSGGDSSKAHLVNFSYLLRTDNGAPRTIEFRQHEGSLDEEEVSIWIDFVVGIVMLAEKMAGEFGVGDEGEGGYEGEGYRWQEWDEGLGVGDLVEMMGMGERGRGWVERRVGMWEGEE